MTGAIVVLPQGVAFATIAGMPPQYGLYASIVPTIIAALFGSSWHLVAGPSTTASLVLAASLSSFAMPGSVDYVKLAMTLAVMAGLIELALGLFKMGVIVNFISHSVVVGYTAGVGILIIATQLKNFFGLDVENSHEFITAIYDVVRTLPTMSVATTAVALATLGAGILSRRYMPRIPYMLPAIAIGGVTAAAINAASPGAIATVGAMPAQLPPLSAPSFDPHVWRLLIPTALAVAISALNEVVSISRALAIRSEQHLDINQEFVGQGLANIIGSFFSGYVVSGSFNRSALNYESGARTPLAAVSASLVLVALLLAAAPAAAYLPKAAMAASLVLIGWGLIDQRSIRHIWTTSYSERWILVVSIFTALFVHIQIAILAGVALSLLMFLYRTSRPPLRPRVPDPATPNRKFTDARPDLPECPQVRVLRLDGSLYFGAVSSFRESLRNLERETPGCKQIAIVMTGANFIDLAGAEALALEARKIKARGGSLYLIRVKESVMGFLKKGGYLKDFGDNRIFWSKTNAFQEIFQGVDRAICRTCDRRVFLECDQFAEEGRSIDGDTAVKQLPSSRIAQVSLAGQVARE
ncbi:SulP family inorganic anion transporter [Bradyrhizobium sp. NP1]|uniref:SulP family inorganic anion transporter n=1 Tax=Bradyrhizobium sp. NP1 TaxID=3049772 RepID=UPI0025A5CD5A|nr:SulP family inorganic anion transporter [Bradyrhizobium sp. NP1]WJR79163.1 SulP family inorganic anion transporter [Bradyrhizobium sp. NP1]